MIIPTIKLISFNNADSVTVLALKLSTTHSYMYFSIVKICGNIPHTSGVGGGGEIWNPPPPLDSCIYTLLYSTYVSCFNIDIYTHSMSQWASVWEWPCWGHSCSGVSPGCSQHSQTSRHHHSEDYEQPTSRGQAGNECCVCDEGYQTRPYKWPLWCR